MVRVLSRCPHEFEMSGKVVGHYRIAVAHQTVSTRRDADASGRSAAGEKIEYDVAGPRQRLHETFDNRRRLLGWVSDAFSAVSVEPVHSPYIRRVFPFLGVFRIQPLVPQRRFQVLLGIGLRNRAPVPHPNRSNSRSTSPARRSLRIGSQNTDGRTSRWGNAR